MISLTNKNRIWICGIADAFSTTILILSLFLGDPNDLLKLSTTHLTFFIFGILPFSMFVGWRGMKDAAKLLSGNHVFIHAPMEGFLWGFFISLTIWFASYLGEVMAAGGHFDEVIGQPTNLMAWLRIFMMVIPFSFVAGIIGSILASVLHLINRFLVSVPET